MKALSLALGIFVLLLTGCTNQPKDATPKFQVGLVLDKGGVDDKSFNASAFAGAKRAESELGVTVREVEVLDDTQLEPTLKTFAKKNFDLVISVGYVQQEALKKSAEANPNTKFAIVDAEVDLPNVASLLFKEHEGSFLAGAAAALKSKSGTIGFIGGMDIPLIRRFEYGFRQGILQVNPKAKILIHYIGVTGEAWNNPTKAKELALTQIQQGADVIFSAAGASGLGVFDAVEEKSKERQKKGQTPIFAIGVDSNQNWIKPGLILTSMLKRVDQAVFETIKSAKDGGFKSGKREFGLNDQGIDLAKDEFNKDIFEAGLSAKIDKLKAEILSGEVKVVDYYLLPQKK